MPGPQRGDAPPTSAHANPESESSGPADQQAPPTLRDRHPRRVRRTGTTTHAVRPRHRGTPWQNQTPKLRLSRKSLIGTHSYYRSFTTFRTRHTTPNGSPATARTPCPSTRDARPVNKIVDLKTAVSEGERRRTAR